MKTQKAIILFTSFITFIVTSVSAEEIDYTKHFSLKLSYSHENSGVFMAVLKNISKFTHHVMLNTKEIEGYFMVLSGKNITSQIMDEDYLNRVATSQWFSGFCDLKPGEEIKWLAKLDELVYCSSKDKPVTQESLIDKNLSLHLLHFSITPTHGKSSLNVKLKSNSIKIAKTHTREKNKTKQNAGN